MNWGRQCLPLYFVYRVSDIMHSIFGHLVNLACTWKGPEKHGKCFFWVIWSPIRWIFVIFGERFLGDSPVDHWIVLDGRPDCEGLLWACPLYASKEGGWFSGPATGIVLGDIRLHLASMISGAFDWSRRRARYSNMGRARLDECQPRLDETVLSTPRQSYIRSSFYFCWKFFLH